MHSLISHRAPNESDAWNCIHGGPLSHPQNFPFELFLQILKTLRSFWPAELLRAHFMSDACYDMTNVVFRHQLVHTAPHFGLCNDWIYFGQSLNLCRSMTSITTRATNKILDSRVASNSLCRAFQSSQIFVTRQLFPVYRDSDSCHFLCKSGARTKMEQWFTPNIRG